ncbi:hypothetical protein [Pantoea sp. Nvir]|uniref:hypothetical protein n=1 Tax=Pantoea sp. Nvir TaxID=2576760 RepID=UPI001357684B|nr:hypothetical protein [Pantoea sp. Nvir]CAJ0992565.1 hypothetical protein NVIRPANT_00697 [Pantoea sp. Nvir]
MKRYNSPIFRTANSINSMLLSQQQPRRLVGKKYFVCGMRFKQALFLKMDKLKSTLAVY